MSYYRQTDIQIKIRTCTLILTQTNTQPQTYNNTRIQHGIMEIYNEHTKNMQRHFHTDTHTYLYRMTTLESIEFQSPVKFRRSKLGPDVILGEKVIDTKVFYP